MGIQDLQTFLENEGVGVDLFRIARNHAGGFRLVLDAEGCLDRLYGGYFSDWACGGQWARCVQFLTTLAQALAEHQVALCVCFNGAHPTPPALPQHWIQTQATYRQRVNSVLRHIATKGTPPPKVWWVPPMGLHSCLRTALRYLNIPIMVSSDDHCQEVVGLCREKTYAGLVGCSGEYLVFQPPRYFSSSQLKLTYRSSLETKEYMVHELPQVLDVPQDRLCLMAALLGGTILSEQSLVDFYKRLGITQKKQVPPEALVKAICQYVRELPSSDIDAACIDVFGDLNDLRAAKLKQAVQYYLNGTKDGFLKYRTASGRRPKNNKKNQKSDISPQSTSLDLDTSKLAAESSEHEQKGLDDYKLATANASINADFSMEERPSDIQHGLAAVSLDSGDTGAAKQQTINPADKNEKPQSAPKEVRPNIKQVHNEDNCPPAPAEVLRTCAERHARGLMHPQMLSILTHRQVTLPVLMEDDNHREIPSIHHFFRPVRQNVYAILYNMHHHRFMAQKAKEEGSTSSVNNDRPCTVQVAEWIYSRVNPGKSPEVVPGVVLDWPVPTVQRLWFGTAQDDKCRRMRAFLSCMRSDTPLMLNTSYVPQHLLILATVLRFIMTSQIQILRRQELDAFLATAFSNDLMNALHLQEMTVNGINSRGVQLGALVMAGAEAALLANDACGAPVPWLVAAPWLYFDGKLLQRNLHRANHCKHLAQLCDNHLDTVVKVERMRKAILEGLEVEFAMPPLPLVAGVVGGSLGGQLGGWPRGRGRGARLEIAGVVVGQWGGGSYPTRTTRYPQREQLPTTSRIQNGYSPSPNYETSIDSSRTSSSQGDKLNEDNEFLKNVSAIPKMSYEDLKEATNNWSESNLLGRGGFGQVFKGEWKHLPVAVKRLLDNNDHNKELIREMCLNQYRHDNILPLYGYSLGGPEACLVYQLMGGGSLEQRLRMKTHHPPLTWTQRYNIAHGVARGLQFLHTMAGTPLIHGDIKPANILLDTCLMPKIGDFGLARKGPYGDDRTHVKVSKVFGTKPYLPDEYLRDRSLSPAVDVFSYGVVVVEMATALPANDKTRPEQFLSMYIHQLYNRGLDMATLEDPVLLGTNHSNPAMCLAFIAIGLHCTKYARHQRPTMLEVYKKLNDMKGPNICT